MVKDTIEVGVSLEEVLEDREWRDRKQRELINEYNKPLVALKLNIPGPVKNNSLYLKVFETGMEELITRAEEKSMEILWRKCYYKGVGPIFVAVLDMNPYNIKELTISIEENHPLGRLFDFDVWDCDYHQISRRDLGYDFRKCFLCEENAFICARNKNHSLEELLEEINKMAEAYFSIH